MTQASRTILPTLIGGLALSVVGVITAFVLPNSRTVTPTPLTLIQCIAMFGGSSLTLFALGLRRDTQDERNAAIRSGTRICLLASVIFALLAWFHTPFAIIIAIVVAMTFHEPFRHLFAWLGRA